MRSCLPTLLRVGQAWPTIRFGGYRQFFGFRSPYAGSSVASGRIEFVSPRSRNTTFLRTILSLSVALHEALLARSYFRLLTGSSAREGLSPSCSSALPSAQMSLLTELKHFWILFLQRCRAYGAWAAENCFVFFAFLCGY